MLVFCVKIFRTKITRLGHAIPGMFFFSLEKIRLESKLDSL